MPLAVETCDCMRKTPTEDANPNADSLSAEVNGMFVVGAWAILTHVIDRNLIFCQAPFFEASCGTIAGQVLSDSLGKSKGHGERIFFCAPTRHRRTVLFHFCVCVSRAKMQSRQTAKRAPKFRPALGREASGRTIVSLSAARQGVHKSASAGR